VQKYGISASFTRLWERKRLDLSVEAFVLRRERLGPRSPG
jgi:hypothetical protein